LETPPDEGGGFETASKRQTEYWKERHGALHWQVVSGLPGQLHNLEHELRQALKPIDEALADLDRAKAQLEQDA
jgi:hypothetical protein